MPKVAFFILALFCFGPQFYFGLVGSGFLTPLLWSLGMALFAVGTGWRAPQKGIPTSIMIGTGYAAVVNVPLYLIGSWLGGPGQSSITFTVVASALGLLAFGLLTLLRRTWPRQAPDTKPPSSEDDLSPTEAPAVFKKLRRLLENEKAQNERLIEPYRSRVRGGADCDEVAGAVGEFGRDPRNPIPVNGPMGEIIYLSNLRTTDLQTIMFHRLGSISNVHIYETVSIDGAMWDILFLDQYHPRKSQRAPSGCRIVTGAERNGLVLGVNTLVIPFPDHLPDAIATMSERIFGYSIRPLQVREALGRAIFERPTEHLTRLDTVVAVLKRQALS